MKKRLHRPAPPTSRMPRIIKTTPKKARTGLQDGTGPSGMLHRRQAGIAGGTVAVEEVVGVEGDDLSPRRHEVDAGTLHGRQAEVEAVEELHDDDAEDAVVAEVSRHLELRQAAQQAAQRRLRLLAGG